MDPLELEGTKLLRQRGYDRHGNRLTSKGTAPASVNLKVSSVSPELIEGLVPYDGFGGGIHLCHHHKEQVDMASDCEENVKTLIELQLDDEA